MLVQVENFFHCIQSVVWDLVPDDIGKAKVVDGSFDKEKIRNWMKKSKVFLISQYYVFKNELFLAK